MNFPWLVTPALKPYQKMAKVFQSRAHRERAQPANRARLGLLEKKSDYLQRARDHQSKRKRIKAMKIRAAYKNPDEFYFKMQSTKRDRQSGRVKVAGEHEKLSSDVVKLMKSQDLQSLNELVRVNERKLDQLKFEHNAVIEESAVAKHTKFVVDDEELADLIINTATQKKELKRQRQEDAKLRTAPEAVIAEFAARSERLAQLRIAVKKLEQEHLACAKGRKNKIGEDANGIPVYKFDPIRKK
jgi:U3 small nucleolar RNA-associated protein 11